MRSSDSDGTALGHTRGGALHRVPTARSTGAMTMDVALDVRPVATLARAATIETTGRAEQGQPAPSRVALEQARDYLLERLHARSDDFAATEELQAVRAEL